MRPLLIFLLISFSYSLFAQSRTEVPYSMPSFPKFPGGDTALWHFVQGNIKYPDSARAYDIQGKVLVLFEVQADGSLNKIKVVRSVNKYLDEEALRVVKLLRFEPAKDTDKYVPISYGLPINFKLE